MFPNGFPGIDGHSGELGKDAYVENRVCPDLRKMIVGVEFTVLKVCRARGMLYGWAMMGESETPVGPSVIAVEAKA
jgi:hypothetical protein